MHETFGTQVGMCWLMAWLCMWHEVCVGKQRESQRDDAALSAAPVVSEVKQSNVPMSGGAYVTLTGLNFGMYGFTPTAAVQKQGDLGCSSSSWTSDTTMACRTAATTSAKQRYVKVTVGAIVGTRVGFAFTYDGNKL